ncbi:MAG: outer membrane beta-barrel protein [Pseudomonadota bacterium]|nr:outer membrane beta-barrel protein [Pseudomonadota bacterium]
MQKRWLAIAALGGLVSMPASAAELGYDYVDVDYRFLNADDDDLEGFGLNISLGLTDNIIGRIRNAYTEGDEVDIEILDLSVGAGYRYGASEQLDVFGLVNWVRREFDLFVGDDAEDNGYSVMAGVRFGPVERLELNADVEYIDVLDDSETVLGLGAVLGVWSRFHVFARAELTDDVETYRLGGRIAF